MTGWVLVGLVYATMEFKVFPDREHPRIFHTEQGCLYVKHQVEKLIEKEIVTNQFHQECVPVDSVIDQLNGQDIVNAFPHDT